PAVVIGVSPKSFGWYHHNHQERKGVDFLKNLKSPELAEKLSKILLPGSDWNTSWLFALQTIQENFGSDFDLRVAYSEYRRLQLRDLFRRAFVAPQEGGRDAFLSGVMQMSAREIVLYGSGLGARALARTLTPDLLKSRVWRFLGRSELLVRGRFHSLRDVY